MNETEREAVHEMLRRRSARRADTPGNARQWLIEEGIHNDDGKLSPRYGGSASDPEAG